jgi:MFS family permease
MITNSTYFFNSVCWAGMMVSAAFWGKLSDRFGRKVALVISGPVVIKKDDELLLNLTGTMSRCSREKVLICAQKRELESPI